MEGRAVPGNKFFVQVAGNTNGTHTAFVSHFEKWNQVQVFSKEDSDFILVFCPVVSRVGTDIAEALQGLDRNKAKVLVVMHHTFNPDTAIAESRRQVEDPNVLLTVDVLFHEHRLLSCNYNDIAWDQLCRVLGIPLPQASGSQRCSECFKKNRVIVIVFVGILVLLALIVLIIVLTLVETEHQAPPPTTTPPQFNHSSSTPPADGRLHV